MEESFNTRILVIDDDENVRHNFREILCPEERRNENASLLNNLSSILFDASPSAEVRRRRSSVVFDFEFDEANSGRQGYEKVEKAIRENRPYAAIFVDMRMPEWDGLETVRHLREIDVRAEVIFVTAYSDHSIEEIVTAVGTNVSYHCKPFSAAEIEQIATKSVYEWNKTRTLEELIRNISKLRAQNWEMDALLHNVLSQVAYLLGTHSALIAIRKNGQYERNIAIGNLCDDNISRHYLADLPAEMESEIFQNDELAYFRMDEFGILAIFEKDGKPINHERLYIVRLFLEQASLAIRNVDLQEALIRQEKLSAIGQAISMLFHDMRNSVGNIISITELMARHLDDREYTMKMLGIIGECAEGGMRMVSDMRDFIGNKPIEKQRLSVKDMLASVISFLRESPLLKKIELTVNPVVEAEFMGDQSKMIRVFVNLVNNAAEALTAAGTPAPKIVIDTCHDKNTLIFRVSDNGPGIPPEIRDKVFLPFVTCGKAEGTGLGLAIVKRFVECHGGTIEVESSATGTAFTIMVPDGNTNS